jgi:hypothetical protein
MDSVLKSKIVSVDTLKSKKASPIIGNFKVNIKLSIVEFIVFLLSSKFPKWDF